MFLLGTKAQTTLPALTAHIMPKTMPKTMPGPAAAAGKASLCAPCTSGGAETPGRAVPSVTCTHHLPPALPHPAAAAVRLSHGILCLQSCWLCPGGSQGVVAPAVTGEGSSAAFGASGASPEAAAPPCLCSTAQLPGPAPAQLPWALGDDGEQLGYPRNREGIPPARQPGCPALTSGSKGAQSPVCARASLCSWGWALAQPQPTEQVTHSATTTEQSGAGMPGALSQLSQGHLCHWILPWVENWLKH